MINLDHNGQLYTEDVLRCRSVDFLNAFTDDDNDIYLKEDDVVLTFTESGLRAEPFYSHKKHIDLELDDIELEKPCLYRCSKGISDDIHGEDYICSILSNLTNSRDELVQCSTKELSLFVFNQILKDHGFSRFDMTQPSMDLIITISKQEMDQIRCDFYEVVRTIFVKKICSTDNSAHIFEHSLYDVKVNIIRSLVKSVICFCKHKKVDIMRTDLLNHIERFTSAVNGIEIVLKNLSISS